MDLGTNVYYTGHTTLYSRSWVEVIRPYLPMAGMVLLVLLLVVAIALVVSHRTKSAGGDSPEG